MRVDEPMLEWLSFSWIVWSLEVERLRNSILTDPCHHPSGKDSVSRALRGLITLLSSLSAIRTTFVIVEFLQR